MESCNQSFIPPYDRIQKENIAVNFKNRTSPQVVRLLNYENEFYGKHYGKVYTDGGRFNNVELSNVSFYNEEGKKVELSHIFNLDERVKNNREDIDTLSIHVHNDFPKSISSWISSIASAYVSAEAETRSNADVNLGGKIDTERDRITEISGGLSSYLIKDDVRMGYDNDHYDIVLSVKDTTHRVSMVDMLSARTFHHANVAEKDDKPFLVLWMSISAVVDKKQYVWSKYNWNPYREEISGVAKNGKDYVDIDIKVLTQIYKSGDGISVDNNLSINVDSTVVRKSQFDPLSTQVQSLKEDGYNTIKFNGTYIVSSLNDIYISSIFDTALCTGDEKTVRNGSMVDVKFDLLYVDISSMLSTLDVPSLSIGHQDIMIVREKTPVMDIPISSLNSDNVYIFHTAIPSYEFYKLKQEMGEDVRTQIEEIKKELMSKIIVISE